VTDLVARLTAALDETEAWARAASQTYEYADEGSKVPEGGVHWRWVVGENWDEVTPDPMTTQFLEGPDGSWSANLATVEEWPSTSRIDEERTRTTMMRRVYANAIDEMDPAAAGHIVRHDPASVLRMVAAHRKLLDWLVMCEDKALDNNWWSLDVNAAIEALAEAYGVEA
jgi:hypothetical protein